MRKNVVAEQEMEQPVTKPTYESLDSLLEEYLATKAESDMISAKLDGQKAEIRKYLEDMEDLKYSSDVATATLQERKSVSMNEAGLISVLKKLDITDPIETKEVINNIRLEDAMRRGELPYLEVKPFITEKTTYAVVVRRKK